MTLVIVPFETVIWTCTAPKRVSAAAPVNVPEAPLAAFGAAVVRGGLPDLRAKTRGGALE